MTNYGESNCVGFWCF